MHLIGDSITDNIITAQYTTFENLNENQIRYRFCGELSSDECSISEYTETLMGACTKKTFTMTEPIVTAPRPGGSGEIVLRCPEGCELRSRESQIHDGVFIYYCWDPQRNVQCDDPQVINAKPASNVM
jgi:hypothetical protein